MSSFVLTGVYQFILANYNNPAPFFQMESISSIAYNKSPEDFADEILSNYSKFGFFCQAVAIVLRIKIANYFPCVCKY